MKALILAAIPMIGFACGVVLGKMENPALGGGEEGTDDLREMREDLMSMASEHAMLGDTFAPIAFDRMKETRSNR